MSDFFNEEVDVYNQAYQNVEVKGAIFRNKTLGNITVSSSSFFDCTFDTVVFNHVVFTKVDLSNVNFTNCGLHHCRFVDCKMVGTSFVDSVLKFCSLKNILGRYWGMSYCKLQEFSIVESDLLEGRFMDINHHKLSLESVNLKGVEFNSMPLNGVDLSTCNIEDVLMDVKYLKGAVLSYSQMVDLAPILGIKLK